MVNHVITKPITAADVEAREIEEQVGREIIKGEWAEDNEMAGQLYGLIGMKILLKLAPFVEIRKLGQVYPDGVNYVLEGTKGNIITMRIPDVSFVAEARVDRSSPEYYYFSPDLAIEIVSPQEKSRNTAGKVEDYLRFGSRQVWIVYPEQQQIVVKLPDGTSQTYGISDRLSGGDVLPNFELNVADIF